jgi:hypothetical protein
MLESLAWSRREESVSSDDDPSLEPNPGNSRSPVDMSKPTLPTTKVMQINSSSDLWSLNTKGKQFELDSKALSTHSGLKPGGSSEPFEKREISPRHQLLPEDRRQSEEQKLQNESLRLELPASPSAPYTVAQVQTPGWDTPWSPTGPRYSEMLQHASGQPQKEASLYTNHETSSNRPDTSMSRRSHKRIVRKFILNNTYVPLVCFSSVAIFRWLICSFFGS